MRVAHRHLDGGVTEEFLVRPFDVEMAIIIIGVDVPATVLAQVGDGDPIRFEKCHAGVAIGNALAVMERRRTSSAATP